MNKTLVDEWIYKAEQDFESAHYLSEKQTQPVPDVVCFHCQQCIEKYLKAYLTQNKVEPPEIHDLQRLNNLCRTLDSSFTQIRDGLDMLNAYAVDFRYPGDVATDEDSKQAFKITKDIRTFLRTKLNLKR